jgi:hypothetical protein
MFGDPVENLLYDIAAAKEEIDKLRRLVHEACKLAFEHGGKRVDPHVARILKEAGLFTSGDHI